MKTIVRKKEDSHGKKERQETGQQPKVKLTVVPADVPIRRPNLNMVRLVLADQIKVFEADLLELFEIFAKKSGEDRNVCKDNLLDFVAYSHIPGVFFIVGVDENYKCRMYCLAHLAAGATFFIRQVVYDQRYKHSVMDSWKFIEKQAKDAGCRVIEGNTRRREKSYTKWIERFGMTKQCVVYRKEVI